MQNRFGEVRRHLRNLKWFLSKNRKSIPLVVGLVLLGGLQTTQLIYSGDRMLPGASVDGVDVSRMNKSEAVKKLDGLYNKQKIAIKLGEMEDIALTPTFAKIGTTTSNEERIDNVNYPWYLRIIPSSLFWAAQVVDYGEPSINKDDQKLEDYLNSGVKGSCSVDPKPASLKANGEKLELVPSKDGLRCEDEDLKATLESVQPDISKDRVDAVVAAEQLPPEVSDGVAEDLARHIERNTDGGVRIEVADTVAVIQQKDVLSWLDFAPTKDGSLEVSINSDRSSSYLSDVLESRVRVDPGVSQVTTRDFVEVERKDGKTGRALAVAETTEQIRQVVIGQSDIAQTVTVSVPPRIEYTRTYSRTDKGFSALLTNFAKDNEGTFGISLVELSGKRRRAAYQADKQFVTASTYKLFVAYSTLLRVESGKFSWSNHVSGGRSLSTCFDDMIAKSDNPCPEALLDMIGYTEITNEAKRLGLTNTTFLEGDRPLTTAEDLAIFLATLESGQMLTSPSRTKLLNAMHGNVFREGVPAGSKGKVANKVGFLSNLLHDAAIVTGVNGKYVLVVLSEDSSWQTIAKLTREIEKLRGS